MITPRRQLLKVLFLLFVMGVCGKLVAAQGDPKPRVKVLDSVSTKVGVLQLRRVHDDGIGETNWYVALKGKILYRTKDDVFGSVSFHTIFKSNDEDEILLQETFDTGGCVQFRMILITQAAKPTVSERFGNCNGRPVITQDAGMVKFDFPVKAPLASRNGVWIYKAGSLIKQ